MHDVQYSSTQFQSREFVGFREGPRVSQLMKGDISTGYSSAIKNNYELTSLPTDSRRAMADTGDLIHSGQSSKKTRVKESSRYFGVRYRHDLQKWVAEIRVAEWKSVDKKVWLGTFDSEVGAARAVDAARKLLNCKKKRAFNVHSPELERFAERERIPPCLNLKNLQDDSMFKNVTLFIKRKVQEYAASSCTITLPESSEPLSTFLHVDLNPGLYDKSQREVMSVATPSFEVEQSKDLDYACYSVAARPYSDMSSTTASSFSPSSSVSDNCWTRLGTSPKVNTKTIQVESFCCEHFQSGHDIEEYILEEFADESSLEYSGNGLEHSVTTSHPLKQSEYLDPVCCETSGMEAIQYDMWDIIDANFPPSQFSLDDTAMCISSGYQDQPNFDILTHNRALPQQKLLPDESADWCYNTLPSANQCYMNMFEFTQAVC